MMLDLKIISLFLLGISNARGENGLRNTHVESVVSETRDGLTIEFDRIGRGHVSGQICVDSQQRKFDYGEHKLFRDGTADECAHYCVHMHDESTLEHLVGFNYHFEDSLCQCLYNNSEGVEGVFDSFRESNNGKGLVDGTEHNAGWQCYAGVDRRTGRTRTRTRTSPRRKRKRTTRRKKTIRGKRPNRRKRTAMRKRTAWRKRTALRKKTARRKRMARRGRIRRRRSRIWSRCGRHRCSKSSSSSNSSKSSKSSKISKRRNMSMTNVGGNNAGESNLCSSDADCLNAALSNCRFDNSSLGVGVCGAEPDESPVWYSAQIKSDDPS